METKQKSCDYYPCYLIEMFRSKPELFDLLQIDNPTDCGQSENCQSAKFFNRYGTDYLPQTLAKQGCPYDVPLGIGAMTAEGLVRLIK